MLTNNEPKKLNNRMIKLLLDANRKRIAEDIANKTDAFTITMGLFPNPDAIHSDSLTLVKEEIELSMHTGIFSFDKGFMPALSDFTSFSSYMIACWDKFSAIKGKGRKATELGSIDDPKIINQVVRYCELPKVFNAVAKSPFKSSEDLAALDKLTVPDKAYRAELLKELSGAEGYRQLIKLSHSVILTEEEVKEHFSKLTSVDLSWGHAATYSSWLYDEQGERVRKMKDHQVVLTPDVVLKLTTNTAIHQAMQAVHMMNLDLISKVKTEKAAVADKARELQEATESAERNKLHKQRVAEVTEKVQSGTATAAELSEYLTW